jgi:hypothetical protein
MQVPEMALVIHSLLKTGWRSAAQLEFMALVEIEVSFSGKRSSEDQSRY